MTPNTVFIIDDESDIREALVGVLSDEGYSVVSAENGRDGLDKLSQMDAPGLILLDLMMPVLNGEEFLREKMADPKLSGVPVIVLSAVPTLFKSLPVQGSLKKPVDIEKLLREVEKFCVPSQKSSL